MKPGAQIVISAAARLYAPVIALFALTILAGHPPGAGVGLIAGAAFALAVVLHALVFGAGASRAAFPPAALRLVMVAGVVAAVAGAGAPGWTYAARLVEGGLFAATAAAAALAVQVLFGRASMLRDAGWQ